MKHKLIYFALSFALILIVSAGPPVTSHSGSGEYSADTQSNQIPSYKRSTSRNSGGTTTTRPYTSEALDNLIRSITPGTLRPHTLKHQVQERILKLQEQRRKNPQSSCGIFLDCGQSKRWLNDSWVHCPAEIHPKYNKPKPDNHCKPLNPTPVKVSIVYSGSFFTIDKPIKPDSPTPPEKRWALKELTNIIVAGVDTPKTNGKCSAEKQKAIKARAFVQNLIMDKSVILQKMIIRKYSGLVIADVILDGGESLADKLINEGLGHYHSYGKNEEWCPVE